MRKDAKPRYWIWGFGCAFLIIWFVAAVFGNTLLLYTWSSDIGTWIRVPGSVYRERSEGWAKSQFGQYDIIGIHDVSIITSPAIVIWGDSYVEALQVEQKERMQEKLKSLWRANGINNYTAFGIGNSGENIADYYFKIPRYEKLCPTIVAHFIVITSLDDILPDQPLHNGAAFTSKPAYQFIDRHRQPEFRQAKEVLNKFGLDFIWQPARSFAKDKKLQFLPGLRNIGLQHTENVSAKDCDKAFAFIANALRHQTVKPVFIVYCPELPRIMDGKVRYEDVDADIISVFARECKNSGIGFIDMSQELRKYYHETGAFPRGFKNSIPSEGHLNAGGHDLIAKAIYLEWLSFNKE